MRAQESVRFSIVYISAIITSLESTQASLGARAASAFADARVLTAWREYRRGSGRLSASISETPTTLFRFSSRPSAGCVARRFHFFAIPDHLSLVRQLKSTLNFDGLTLTSETLRDQADVAWCAACCFTPVISI